MMIPHGLLMAVFVGSGKAALLASGALLVERLGRLSAAAHQDHYRGRRLVVLMPVSSGMRPFILSRLNTLYSLQHLDADLTHAHTLECILNYGDDSQTYRVS